MLSVALSLWRARMAQLGLDQRVIALTGATLITAIAWAYLFYTGWEMQFMDNHMPMPLMPPLVMFSMWAIMMIAMMIPSAMPFIALVASVSKKRSPGNSAFLVTMLFLSGYLISWTGFSALATLIQLKLHEIRIISPMMVSISPWFSGLLLMAVGIYQWTSFKQACLLHCRSPLNFLMTEWREGNLGALRMGMRHGFYCIGCCWLIMGLLLLFGVMNLLWIIVISVYVLIEKAFSRTLLLSRLCGIAAFLVGLALLITPYL